MRILACFLCTFVANGLARFGYVVLIPIMIFSQTLTPNQSIQLGIAILVGYIFGSVFINVLRKYCSLETIAKINLLIVSFSFLACSLNSFPFLWAWIWRFLAGAASASLMILSAPLSLPYVKERARGSVSGIVFSGVGFGAVVSGFLLPIIARENINYAWFVLSGVSFLAFIISLFALRTPTNHKKHGALPNEKQTTHLNTNNQSLQNPIATKNLISQSNNNSIAFTQQKFIITLSLWLLISSYILNAIGYLPHTLFWVNYLARELHFSLTDSGASWALFGFGATIGSIGSGILADKIGVKNAHFVVLGLKVLSCFLAAFLHDLLWLNLSIFLMGFTTTGNATLTNTLAFNIVGKQHFTSASSTLTFSFALFQALFSFIFTTLLMPVGYFWLFIFCGCCVIVSALVLLPIKDCR